MNDDQRKRLNDLRNDPNRTPEEDKEMRKLAKMEADENASKMNESENPDMENSEDANRPEGEQNA